VGVSTHTLLMGGILIMFPSHISIDEEDKNEIISFVEPNRDASKSYRAEAPVAVALCHTALYILHSKVSLDLTSKRFKALSLPSVFMVRLCFYSIICFSIK